MISTADLDDQIAESDETNNSYLMRLRLWPKRRIVKQIKGQCKLSVQLKG